MDKLLLVVTLAGAAYLGLAPALQPDPPSPADAPAATQPDPADQALENAYRNRARHYQVSGSGTAIKLLADDYAGSRHQRFILRQIPAGPYWYRITSTSRRVSPRCKWAIPSNSMANMRGMPEAACGTGRITTRKDVMRRAG